jgi:hypothetical protein
VRESDHASGCGCDGDCDRRDFLAAMSTALGGSMLTSLQTDGAEGLASEAKPEDNRLATIRVAFLYPPSKTFANKPDGWWSWPGNDFDAEGRQRQYTAALRDIEKKLGVQLAIDERPVADNAQAQALGKELQARRPDGLLLVMFYNGSLGQADNLLKTAEKAGIPVVFYIALGVKHGPVGHYRRPGVYFIQSLENLEAIEYGLRMIHARKRMARARLLRITEAPKPRDGVEPFFGATVRVVPFARYAAEFQKVSIDDDARRVMAQFTNGARQQRGITRQSLENAARAHLALKKMLADENADAVAMNCLRRGMLKPCMSFSLLNNELVPAACQNDLTSVCCQMLGKLLAGRPGFIHNICYETEGNHFYASHCTCPTKLHGPDGPDAPYLLRRFAHTNEGSCAIQVFWNEGDPVTMVQYYPGKEPALDVYAGRVVKSHAMPPTAGCTTNVEVQIADLADACQVGGGDWHNVLFCGDFARKFRLFARLFKMKLLGDSRQVV